MILVKTSQSSPLRIDAIAVGNGQLGMTFCPGKKQPISYSGPWNRDLQTDLKVIKDWGAVGLVSLMEDHELKELRIAEIGQQAEELGLEWHHLPITDLSVPGSAFETTWQYSGHRLRQILQNGQNIVLHCKGGLGRTGTIAARLLVEFGASSSQAIADVRIARPGTIETSSQEQYVHQCQPVSSDPTFVDKVLGCILGGAIGDAFGYVVEFDSMSSIQAKYGPNGLQKAIYQNEQFVVSDDTQMTMFTLEGLLAGLGQPNHDNEVMRESIRLSYLDWCQRRSKNTPEAGVKVHHLP